MYCNLCQVNVKIPQSHDVIITNELCWDSMDNLLQTSGVYYVHTYPGSTCSRAHICIWRACLHFWPSGVPSSLQCHIYTAGPGPVCWAPWGPHWPTHPDEASFKLDRGEKIFVTMLLPKPPCCFARLPVIWNTNRHRRSHTTEASIIKSSFCLLLFIYYGFLSHCVTWHSCYYKTMLNFSLKN